MIKYLFFLILCSLLSSDLLHAQNWSHYRWDTAHNFNNVVFEKATNFFKQHYKDNIYVGDLNEKAANYHAAGFYTDYAFGNFYSDFYGYESYIKKILAKVIKDTLTLKNLNIYFYYSPDYNASMDAFGNIRLNVGLFQYLKNEAELAAILAHEYGHFINKDMINDNLPSKQKETTADYQAIKLIKASDYSSKGLSNVFKEFKRFEIKEELLHGNNEVHSVTHPDPGERLKQVKMLAKDSSNIGKKMFLVDSSKFISLKKIAVQESFNIMVGYRRFSEIIELAFTQYLYEPENHDNLALLNESIRRYLLLNPNSSSKQFIISNYKGKGSKKSDNYKYVDDDKTSILNYLNKGLLHLPSNDLSKIKAIELLDSIKPKFTTYKEAFSYFSSKAKSQNCKSCMISDIFKNENKTIYSEEAIANNTVFDCFNFLNDLKSIPKFTEDLYVLNFPSIDNLDYFKVNSPVTYTEFLSSYFKVIKEENKLKNIFLIQELPFNDQHQLNFVNSLAESVVEENLYDKAIAANAQYHGTGHINPVANQHVSKRVKLDWKNYAPESYEIFAKYKVKNIYFINFDITNTTVTYTNYGIPMGLKTNRSRSWQFKKVSLDDNGFSNVFYYHNIAITNDSNENCLKECAQYFKSFLSGY